MLASRTKLAGLFVSCAGVYAVACVGSEATSPPVTQQPAADSGSQVQADGASTTDGGNPGSACGADVPFRAPELVTGLASPQDDDQMTLTPDELRIYFASSRPTPGGDSSYNIWTAERTSLTDAFGAPRPLGLNTSGLEGDPMLSPDGSYLYFTAAPSSSGNFEVYRIAIGAIDTNAREPVAGLNTAGNEMGAFPLADGSFYFVRRPTGGALRIFRAVPNSNGVLETSPASELNSQGPDQTPILSRDGLTVYWASERTDLGTAKGMADIFVASRASLSEPFGNLRRVDELSTSGPEFPGWLSPDGCRLYLTRTEQGIPGTIYVARRGP